MSERQPNPRAIDLSAFCRQGNAASGTWPLAVLSRLASSFSASSDADVSWSAQGRLQPVAGSASELWLDLSASTEVPLQCQRCLQTLAEPLQVDRHIRFVRTDEEAAQLDETSDDDVLVQPARLDLQELLEDELILALPLVPRHTACPEPLPEPSDDLSVPDPAAAPHPFAALAALRKG